ncbi:MAG: low-complexity tail membrane protein [Elainella sp.]
MRSTWSEPYLWLHLAGLAAVPLLLELCLVGLKAVDSPLALVLVAPIGIGPIVWMQWNRPFSIFSLLPLVLQPNHLTETQRRILAQFKSPVGRGITIVMAIVALVLLWKLQQWLPYIRSVDLPGGRLGGLVLAAGTFLLSHLFLQVPASVVPVLLTSDQRLGEPYRVSQIPRDFTLIGLGVKRILPVADGATAAPPPPAPNNAPVSNNAPAPDHPTADLEKRSAAPADPAITPDLIQAELVEPSATNPNQPTIERIQAELITEAAPPTPPIPDASVDISVNAPADTPAEPGPAVAVPLEAEPIELLSVESLAATDQVEPVPAELVAAEPVAAEPIKLVEPDLTASIPAADSLVVQPSQPDPVDSHSVELAPEVAVSATPIAADPLSGLVEDGLPAPESPAEAVAGVQSVSPLESDALASQPPDLAAEETEEDFAEIDLAEPDLAGPDLAEPAQPEIISSGALPTVLVFQPPETARPADTTELPHQISAAQPEAASGPTDMASPPDLRNTADVRNTVVRVGLPVSNPFDEPAIALNQVEVFEAASDAPPDVRNTIVRVG